jgi:hypothetical protein
MVTRHGNVIDPANGRVPSGRQQDWLPSPRRPLVLFLRIPPAKTGRIDPLDHRNPGQTDRPEE